MDVMNIVDSYNVESDYQAQEQGEENEQLPELASPNSVKIAAPTGKSDLLADGQEMNQI